MGYSIVVEQKKQQIPMTLSRQTSSIVAEKNIFIFFHNFGEQKNMCRRKPLSMSKFVQKLLNSIQHICVPLLEHDKRFLQYWQFG